MSLYNVCNISHEFFQMRPLTSHWDTKGASRLSEVLAHHSSVSQWAHLFVLAQSAGVRIFSENTCELFTWANMSSLHGHSQNQSQVYKAPSRWWFSPERLNIPLTIQTDKWKGLYIQASELQCETVVGTDHPSLHQAGDQVGNAVLHW